MDKQLAGRYVATALYRDAAIRCEMGGKAFLALPEHGGDGDCPNCDGCGRHALQLVEGGPFKSPPRAGKEQSAVFQDGDWYLVKTTSYRCLVCGGAGSGKARPAKAEQKPIEF